MSDILLGVGSSAVWPSKITSVVLNIYGPVVVIDYVTASIIWRWGGGGGGTKIGP